MQVYVWGRRHQYVQLSFLGIFNFTAPYLPWVLLAFSLVLRSSPVVDLLGMVAGAHKRPKMQELGITLPYMEEASNEVMTVRA